MNLVVKLKLFSLVFLVIANALVWQAVFAENHGGKLRVAFLNIGQGDAILITAPSGNRLLIDGGPPSSAVLRELSREMPWYDRTINAVISTHPDQDHLGGLPEVLRRYHVGTLLEPGVTSNNGTYQEMERAIAERGVPKLLARRGMIIHLDKRTSFFIFFPDRDLPSNTETNSASIVGKLVYGRESFVFTGDLPLAEENYLSAKEGGNLRANVLKLGHHGSHTSSGDFFLSTVAPEYGVVSAGLNNRYGHPHADTLARTEKHRIQILRTDTQGRIIFETDGQTLAYSTDK